MIRVRQREASLALAIEVVDYLELDGGKASTT